MTPDQLAYWKQRWTEGRTGWHEPGGNQFLQRHWERASVSTSSRVLVPLAGASPDIPWLASRGHPTTAVDVSERAAVQLFAEQRLKPARTEHDAGVCFQWSRIRYQVADFLTVPDAVLGRFDAVYDRASLVALPAAVRARYVARLDRLLAPGARQLLIVFDGDQPADAGPPYVVGEPEIETLYGRRWRIELLEERFEERLGLMERALLLTDVG